jgi:hypothetical protein
MQLEAKQLGVSKAAITQAIGGKTWRHLDEPSAKPRRRWRPSQ